MASSLNHDLTAVKESVHKWTLPEATVCTVFVWFEHIDKHGCFSRIRCTELSLKAMEWVHLDSRTGLETLNTKRKNSMNPAASARLAVSHVSHVMKLRKDRLSDEVPRIDSTGAGSCARINTFAPLGMKICIMCESVTAHFRMGTESYFRFCQLLLKVFWVRDTASMVLQTARRTPS